MNAKKKILVLSKTEKACEMCFCRKDFSISFVSSIDEVNKRVKKEYFHFLLVQIPLQEVSFSLLQEVGHTYKINVLLFVEEENYVQAKERLKESSIFVLRQPCNKQTLLQVLELLEEIQMQMEKKDEKIETLKKKLQEEKIISQAKLVLIEKYHYSEEKAHHIIEKLAMDHGKKKVDIAKMLLLKETK